MNYLYSVQLYKEQIKVNFEKEECTFHTFTFNIESLKTIQEVKHVLEIYINRLKKSTIYRGELKLKYIYSYEIGLDTKHLHVHGIFNIKLSEKEILKLKKEWNILNGWPFYNNKGLHIDVLKTNEDKSNVINYILKNLTLFSDDLIAIYYILTPNKIYHISNLQNLKYDINDIVFDILQEKYKVIRPKLNMVNIKYIYNQWKSMYENINKDLKSLIDVLQDTNISIENKQEKLDLYQNEMYYSIKIENLYSNMDIIKQYFVKYSDLIEVYIENFSNLNKLFFIEIVNIKEIYYYFIDTLITSFRLILKEKNEINNIYNKNDQPNLDWYYKIENQLLKSIFKKNIKYYIFYIKIIEIKKSTIYREAL